MSTSLSIYLFHDTRYAKKSGKYPVKLCVSFGRAPRMFQTIYDLSLEEWDKISAHGRLSKNLGEIRHNLDRLTRQANDYAATIHPFCLSVFVTNFIMTNPLFVERKRKVNAVTEAKDEFDYTPFHKKFSILNEKDLKPGTLGYSTLIYIKKLLRENRIGTAISYHCAYKAIIAFRGNLAFSEITPSFLRQFEFYWLNTDKSKTSIGIYFRAIRAIFNDAISLGYAKKEEYPFAKNRYQIPGGRNIKRALTFEQITAIFNYEPTCPGERWGLDFWLFFYLANGLNPKDACLLKFKNIKGDFIIFYRAKTENTTRSNPKPITVYITEEIRRIIERQGNKDQRPDNYIFPILHPSMSALEAFTRIKSFIKLVNKWIKRICKNIGFDEKVSAMVARHCCATTLKNAGASTEFIQEVLGHKIKRTTEDYLGDFIPEIKKEFATKLVPPKRTLTTSVC